MQHTREGGCNSKTHPLWNLIDFTEEKTPFANTQRQHRSWRHHPVAGSHSVYSQDLGPRRQSARCLDQLQLAAGDQVAQAGALDRAAVRVVARFGAGRQHAQGERTRDQQEREVLRPAPRHRIQYARTRTRTHPRNPHHQSLPLGLNGRATTLTAAAPRHRRGDVGRIRRARRPGESP